MCHCLKNTPNQTTQIMFLFQVQQQIQKTLIYQGRPGDSHMQQIYLENLSMLIPFVTLFKSARMNHIYISRVSSTDGFWNKS